MANPSPDVVRIPIGHGLFAEIDAADAELVAGYNWRRKKQRHPYTTYAQGRVHDSSVHKPGTRQVVQMHRVILGLAPGDARKVDHFDGDGLNNRRGNLRFATPLQNAGNRQRWTAVSGFKGVHPAYWTRGGKRRRVERHPWMTILGKQYLGVFATREEAAMRYNVEARRVFGEFAYLNPVEMG